jgi:hypothetical protein
MRYKGSQGTNVSPAGSRFVVFWNEGVRVLSSWKRRLGRLPALLGLSLLLLACGDVSGVDREAQERALSLWQQRCMSAGEFIRQTIDDVDGAVLASAIPWRRHSLDKPSDAGMPDYWRPEGLFRSSLAWVARGGRRPWGFALVCSKSASGISPRGSPQTKFRSQCEGSR